MVIAAAMGFGGNCVGRGGGVVWMGGWVGVMGPLMGDPNVACRFKKWQCPLVLF